MQHADDGYSRRGNFGSSLVHRMFLMYSPDGTNVNGSRTGEFEGIGSLYGVESCKIVFLEDSSYSLVQTLLPFGDVSFSHNRLRHRQTDDSTMPTADRDRPKKDTLYFEHMFNFPHGIVWPKLRRK